MALAVCRINRPGSSFSWAEDRESLANAMPGLAARGGVLTIDLNPTATAIRLATPGLGKPCAETNLEPTALPGGNL